MKKFVFTSLLLSFFLLLSISAFGQNTEKIKMIRIVTPNWEGQTNKDGTGLFFEIIRSVYEPVGIKIRYKFVPWKRAQSMLTSHQADAMLCVWKEHAKEEGHIIPKYPMFVEYTGVVFKKDKLRDWEGIKTLNGKRAIWLRGYDYHTFSHLKDVKFKKWSEVDDYSQTWGMLERERVDVYIDALIDINKYIKKHQLDMTPYRLEILWEEYAYAAFSKSEKSEKLIDIYNKRIIEVFKSGELKRIYDKWDANFSPDAWSR